MKKNQKIILGISFTVIVAVSVGIGVLLTNPPSWLIQTLVENRMNSRDSPDVEDGLHVLLVGTGSPMSDENRVGPSNLVIAGSQYFAVDAGPGSTRNILLSGIDPGQIDAAFLTHFHSDHIGDLGELMLQRWALGGHSDPLPVYGPVGVTAVVEGFNDAYEMDSLYRNAHHGEENMPINGSGGIAHEFDIGNNSMASAVIYDQDGVKVTMFNVNHLPVYPAVGFKFEYKGRSLVISGDTIYNENLETQATNADVLICEALNPELVGLLEEQADDLTNAGNNTELVLADIPDYHITPWEAATLAQNANVDNLIFTHMIPVLPDSPFTYKQFLGNATELFDGPIILGEDGLFISLTANSNQITYTNLLRDVSPFPTYAVILLSLLIFGLLFAGGWFLTKKKQLRESALLIVVSILMGFLILTRISAFTDTGFVPETVLNFLIEAIVLIWAIMILKQKKNKTPEST